MQDEDTEHVSEDTVQSPLSVSHPSGLGRVRPEMLEVDEPQNPIEELRELKRDEEWMWEWTWLMQWSHSVQDRKENGTRLRLLRAIVERSPHGTYKLLAEQCDVSQRTVQHHMKSLRDRGVVETPGRPSRVEFTSEEMELLAREAASLG